MNATKRKFNALLQGISSPRPATSDDDMNIASRFSPDAAANDAILQKRRRLGFPESTAPTLYRPSPSTTSLSNVVLRRSATQVNSRPAASSPAKYCPGDRSELLKRLATFQEITDWTPKPDKLSEVEWAKRGWICQGKEKVRCVLCHKELLVKLDRKDSDSSEQSILNTSEIGERLQSPWFDRHFADFIDSAEALVDKYSDLIVALHQQDCLWRKRGCGGRNRSDLNLNSRCQFANSALTDTLLRLSFSNASSTLAALRQRYDELCSRSTFLPYEFNLRLPDSVNLDDVLAQLPSDFFTVARPVADKSNATPIVSKSPNRVALALALMGWQGLLNPRIGSVPNSASCHTCLRRLGLWMFKSKEVDQQGNVVVPAPMDHLDPVREHRFYCPWKSALAQSRGTGIMEKEPGLPGWKSLVQTIKNESDLLKLYKLNRAVEAREQGLASPSLERDGTGVPATPAAITPNGNRYTRMPAIVTPGTDGKGDDDEKARDAKDKERWARLRKVKSLFDTKGSKRFRRNSARPGTGDSNKSTTDT